MNAVGSHKKRVSALKRYLIYEPPAVLTLHLKRFQQLEGLTGRMSARKLSGHVYFPVMFDMAPFCCRNVERIAAGEKRLLYSLYGVVVHSGSLSGGHYIAYVKSRHRLKQAHAFLESARNTCADAMSNPVLTSFEDLPADPHLQNDGQWYYCSDSQGKPGDNIHDQPISNIAKFNYLLKAVSGEIQETMTRFQISETGYEEAITWLQSRFGREDVIVEQLYAKLEKLQAEGQTTTDQRKLLDQVATTMTQLASKGQDVNHMQVLNQVFRKFGEQVQIKALKRRIKLPSASMWT
ncbi:hypothetical protein Y032_0573g164 [Ancylostoma ceylanicum]|uniref:USP domain-containing protein n=1 Tax=Ancylostoma ceylanicum TaxID=53326 RepID=A0A016WNU8_9BILA|nr:hypothetical protein Y032_0573g164 [Ancylostoma ceylanicum]